jgi:hypothetical protein
MCIAEAGRPLEQLQEAGMRTAPVETSPAVNAALNQGVNNFDVLDYAGHPRVNGTGQTDIDTCEE